MLARYNVLRPAWFDFLAQSQTVMKGVNLGEVIGPDGSFAGPVANAGEAQKDLLEKQKLLQYDAMFGEGFAHQEMYG